MEKLPTGITQEMIDDAKNKYGEGKVKLAFLPYDDENTSSKAVLIHEPDLNVIGQYQQFSERSWKKANEILVKGCVIGKDDYNEIAANTGLFLAAVDACASMIPVRKSIVKNL